MGYSEEWFLHSFPDIMFECHISLNFQSTAEIFRKRNFSYCELFNIYVRQKRVYQILEDVKSQKKSKLVQH